MRKNTCLSRCSRNSYNCGSNVCAIIQERNTFGSSPVENTAKEPTGPTTTRSSMGYPKPTEAWWSALGATDIQEQKQSRQLELLTRQDTARKK